MNGAMWRSVAVAGLMAGAGLYAAPASAQTGSMTRTWVSGTGNDGNGCTLTSPCLTFARALSQTAVGGEVNCKDAGGFGIATITGSVSIVCENTEAGVLTTSAGTSGIVINGANAVVTLVGLDIDGSGGTGTNGILVSNAAAVVLDNVKIRNFSGFGIRFEPSAASNLTIRKALLTNNGASATPLSGGMYIHPTATASVMIGDSQVSNNFNDGARVETGASGATSISIAHSVFSGNAVGVRFRVPASASSTIVGSINGTTLVNNTGTGLIGNGAGLSVAVSDTTIIGNGFGIAGTGGLSSFGDNRVFGNTTNGGFGGTQVKQ